MKKLNDIFDEIVVLHCVDNSERDISIKNTLKFFDIDKWKYYETVKVPAINTILYEAMPNLHTDFYDKMTYNVKAAVFDCAYNWYKIVKIAYTKGIQHLLVFEDDCLINMSKEEAQQYIDAIPDDFDILKCSYSLNHIGSDVYELTDEETLWKRYKQEYLLYNSTMIGFSRKGMAYYIHIMEKYFLPADIPLAYLSLDDLKHLNYYVASCPLVYDDLSQSDIIGSYDDI